MAERNHQSEYRRNVNRDRRDAERPRAAQRPDGDRRDTERRSQREPQREAQREREPQRAGRQGSRQTAQRPSREASRGTSRGTSRQSSRRQAADTPLQARSGSRTPFFIGLAIAVVVLAVVLGLIVHTCATAGRPAEPQQDNPTPTDQPQPSSDQPSQQPATDNPGERTQAEGQPAYAVWRTQEERLATSTSTNEVPPDRHVVYLTFDDGPSPNTPRVLDILDQYGVKATWFVKTVVPDMQYCKDIWERGHQLAIHCHSHEYEDIYVSTDAFWQGMDHAGELIKEQVGFVPCLIRFPGGSYNGYNGAIADTLIAQTHERGWHYFDWNVSIGDSTAERTVEGLVQNIRNEADGNNSSCVLMHDDGAKIETIDALPQVIQYFIDQGYEFDVITSDTFGYHF